MSEVSDQVKGMPFDPAIYNSAIKAANLVAEECARGRTGTFEGMTVAQWVGCDDVGASSRYMAYTLDDGKTRMPIADYAYPHDYDDLGRCIRMVRACGFTDISPMCATSTKWMRICNNWEDLVCLYDNEEYEAVYDLLNE